ncbi:retention module-containing protein, partial [Casimicrobium huifangae]|uniref:retention module-containing protein n=1 Tax=Casimicrobium huifangae TaxID=2591109 RepID=UPI0037851212
MAAVIARVGKITGEAFVRDADGNLRRLKSGDAIHEGEVVQAGSGGQVQLILADGRDLVVRANEVAKLDAEVAAPDRPDATDSAVLNDQKGFAKISKAVVGPDGTFSFEDDGGRGQGAGVQNEGHSFVELVRVIESVNQLAFHFDTTRWPLTETILGGAPVTLVSQGVVIGSGLGITVNALADIPSTGDQNVSGAEGVGAIAIMLNGADVDGTVASFTIGSLPANGTLTYKGNPVTAGQVIPATANAASLSFTPNAQWSGNTSFQYAATDNEGNTDASPATVSLTVNPVSDAPVLTVAAASGAEDSAIGLTITVGESDVDGSETLGNVTLGNVPAGAVLSAGTNNGDGTWTLTPAQLTGLTITPPANFNGTLNLSVTAVSQDGSAAVATSSTTLVVTVSAAADLTAGNDTGSGNEDNAINGSVTGNDSTTSGGSLSYAKASDPSHGTLVVNVDGSYTYTPTGDYSGPDSFTYTVSDAASGESLTRTVSLTVNPVSDAPVLTVAAASGAEDSAIGLTITVGESDVDGSETLG